MGSLVANPLWAPFGNFFGLIFVPSGDLGASSALVIALMPSFLRFLIDFLLASFKKSSFSVERVVDFEGFVLILQM